MKTTEHGNMRTLGGLAGEAAFETLEPRLLMSGSPAPLPVAPAPAAGAAEIEAPLQPGAALAPQAASSADCTPGASPTQEISVSLPIRASAWNIGMHGVYQVGQEVWVVWQATQHAPCETGAFAYWDGVVRIAPTELPVRQVVLHQRCAWHDGTFTGPTIPDEADAPLREQIAGGTPMDHTFEMYGIFPAFGLPFVEPVEPPFFWSDPWFIPISSVPSSGSGAADPAGQAGENAAAEAVASRLPTGLRPATPPGPRAGGGRAAVLSVLDAMAAARPSPLAGALDRPAIGADREGEVASDIDRVGRVSPPQPPATHAHGPEWLADVLTDPLPRLL